MIYLEKIQLPSQDANVINDSRLDYTHKSAYPFHVLSYQGLFNVEFEEITIVTGGNGSGKSTLLNIIAQKLRLNRPTPFNNTEYFEEYLRRCHIKLSHSAQQLSMGISEYGRIITSDEIFDYLIDNRIKNDEINDKRRAMEDELDYLRRTKMPRSIDFSDAESIHAYRRQSEVKRKTNARYIKDHLGYNLTEKSNGESSFKFFTDAIKPYGLYLLDEPENSLSAEKQIALSSFIASMARFERCQFIISTHSPFIMATPNAKLYNLDVYPARPMLWTEVDTVKTYRNFFIEHDDEFIQ